MQKILKIINNRKNHSQSKYKFISKGDSIPQQTSFFMISMHDSCNRENIAPAILHKHTNQLDLEYCTGLSLKFYGLNGWILKCHIFC